VPETAFAWQNTSLSPRERVEKLVEAMTLEQKIAQLHGAMETIDIYAITRRLRSPGPTWTSLPRRSGSNGMSRRSMSWGYPGSGSLTARWVLVWATVPRARPPRRCR
jgi:hypothetical protein